MILLHAGAQGFSATIFKRIFLVGAAGGGALWRGLAAWLQTVKEDHLVVRLNHTAYRAQMHNVRLLWISAIWLLVFVA